MKAERTPKVEMIAAHNRVAHLYDDRPRVVNLDPALGLFEPVPLFWNGLEYPLRLVTYPEGLRLQRAALELERMAHDPPTTLEEIEDAEAWYEKLVAMFWDFLDPKPLTNPFARLLPQEVGTLLHFFLSAQTKQRGPSRHQTDRRPPSMQ
jgi:hypothetical protein